MVPTQVSRQLYLYSLKLREILHEQVEQLTGERNELRKVRDQLELQATQLSQEITLLQEGREQHGSGTIATVTLEGQREGANLA